jgi:hypothetical protein
MRYKIRKYFDRKRTTASKTFSKEDTSLPYPKRKHFAFRRTGTYGRYTKTVHQTPDEMK